MYLHVFQYMYLGIINLTYYSAAWRTSPRTSELTSLVTDPTLICRHCNAS